MEIRRPLLIIIFLYSNVELPVKTKHTQSFNGTLKLETLDGVTLRHIVLSNIQIAWYCMLYDIDSEVLTCNYTIDYYINSFA